MLRRALTMMILLGIGTCAGAAEIRAMPRLGATITVQDERMVQIGGKRAHGHRSFNRGHGFHRGPRIHTTFTRHKSFMRHQSFTRHQGFARHRSFARHQGGHRYRAHPRHDAFIARRIGKGQFVIVRPVFWPSFRSWRLPPRPLITNGRFARSRYW